ncbi:hypothetical protein CGQ39_15450 [Clostridium botulinum]|uniref:hypothetical protein n=1 Tax=Clostridium botulinum TaxID=1491 RepID=UPI0021FDC22A|nr:hypothetical protein [Clostridium botulinum]QDY22289.1 hypothetical protein CGQ39_15450 [Clostridium botulinum]
MEEKDRNQEKQENFIRLAEQRTNKIIKMLQLLANCSNRSNYEYTDEQVYKIFNIIEKEFRKTKLKFSKKETKFKL